MSAPAFLESLAKGLDPATIARVADGLTTIEARLAEESASPVATVERVASVTLQAGGKRLRPALAFVSGLATGRQVEVSRAAAVGASLEMVHMATLIHDDVIDRADTRRGHPTASRLVGDTAAVLSGDVLLSRAMRLLAEDGDLRIIRVVSAMVVEMAEGEVFELECRGRFDLSRDEHLRILRMKTAAFMECCCRVGALLASADDVAEAALAVYGHELGMAFQIVDDLLDFRGDEAATGKPRGLDFRDGQATLPLIELRPSLDQTEAARFAGLFGNGVTDADLADLAGRMESSGAFTACEAVLAQHHRDAVAALDALPGTEYRELLVGVMGFVCRRTA
jgi:octaprenyl-diphosphate synthase